MSRVRSLCAALVALASSACPPEAPVPGDQVMGTFGLHAVSFGADGGIIDAGVDPGPLPDCQLAEVTGASFDFDATLSRSSANDDAWLTLQGTSRNGVWDGQFFTSSATARRFFPSACADCITFMDETLEVAVLSRTQSELVGGQCPVDALDGGVPSPDARKGVLAPAMTPLGFDAVRACGQLLNRVRATTLTDGGVCAPECDGCQVRYRLTGERK